MPCCYGHSLAAQAAPLALRKSLGVALAADVQRTFTLEAAGYAVQWRHVPAACTPMNRILIARRTRAHRGGSERAAYVGGGGARGCEPCELDGELSTDIH
mmetsp:Transcript_21144/g.62737  ORF Transcript_21144/g.62737 Transcript_21144/m.62737 type:complete len:100 (-) Transcript_21144:58-357(-)